MLLALDVPSQNLGISTSGRRALGVPPPILGLLLFALLAITPLIYLLLGGFYLRGVAKTSRGAVTLLAVAIVMAILLALESTIDWALTGMVPSAYFWWRRLFDRETSPAPNVEKKDPA